MAGTFAFWGMQFRTNQARQFRDTLKTLPSDALRESEPTNP